MNYTIIFDMDGVILDNNSYHKKSFEEFCKRHNMDFSEEIFEKRISGKIYKEIFDDLFGRELSKEELQKYIDETGGIYRELYKDHIVEIAGFSDFIKELKANDVKIALATSAPKVNMDFNLNGLNHVNTFDTIVDADDVVKGKPDPEVFLKAAKKLGVDINSCVVFEDALSGVQAAKAAGMKVVGFTTTHEKEELDVDLAVNDFRELDFLKVKSLFQKD